jgi:hypothetical protein
MLSHVHPLPGATSMQGSRSRAFAVQKVCPLTLPYFSFFRRGFAVLFTEPHPCRASSVTEQLGRGPLPAMELDDGRASPQTDDTTGQSSISINSVTSTRHHPRAGLAQGINPVSRTYAQRERERERERERGNGHTVMECVVCVCVCVCV